jgi:hypothetical protein
VASLIPVSLVPSSVTETLRQMHPDDFIAPQNHSNIHLNSLCKKYRGHDLTWVTWMLCVAYPVLYLFACRSIENKLGAGAGMLMTGFLCTSVRCMVEVERQETVKASRFADWLSFCALTWRISFHQDEGK